MSKPTQQSKKPGEKKTAAGQGKRSQKRKGMCLEDRPILEPNAAGIDIGAREIFVAVPPDRDADPVRVFSTFTEDLEEMAKWLVSCGVTTAAMESTGVYWIPAYDVLEQHGVKPCLVDAQVDGQRNPLELAKLRDPRIKASEETIVKSLQGTWRLEHLFTLKQSRQMYRHYQDQIAACDEEIEKLLVAFQPRVDPAEKALPPDRKKRKRGRQKKNAKTKQGFDLRTESYKIFGVDLTQIPGLMAMVLTLFSEVGRDMSRWKTAGQFVS